VRKVVKRVLLLVVTGVSLYLVFPAILDVFSSWDRVKDLDPFLMQLIVIAEILAFGCYWVLLRVTLREDRWTNVVTSQLAATAASRVIPGGGAAANALQYSMLVRGGAPTATAASGLAAANLAVTGIVFALPALALPAVLGLGHRSIDKHLANAAWAGAAAILLLLAAGVLLLKSDRPLLWTGRTIEAAVNRLRRRAEPTHGLPERLLRERNLIRDVLASRWPEALLATVGRWVFDWAALMLALLAVGAKPAPLAVLLAFCVAQALGLIPLTPGGLGFVEAGLTGTLALAGVPSGEAVVATLAYRLAAYWLPLPIGAGAYFVHRRVFGSSRPATLRRAPS
jgi:putative heme transporter